MIILFSFKFYNLLSDKNRSIESVNQIILMIILIIIITTKILLLLLLLLIIITSAVQVMSTTPAN